jgi:short-subunit dehydrogenase involved in D-alanine esterification of teichoic acids
MAPLYKKALVIGATSGIGEALAAKLITEGTKVIVTGRRQDRLDRFVQKHGAQNATALQLDVNQLDKIASFAVSVTSAHPDLDCVVVNAGIQRAFNFAQPETVNLAELTVELTTNYTSVVYITTAFLPHLQAVQPCGHLVYISATLALVPTLIRTPNYNASKAALHSFIMAVRQQLREAGSTTRLVEAFPPAVQTELHDEKHQPDLVNGGELGMPLDAYTEKLYEGLVRGDEQFATGPGEPWLQEGGWEDQRTKMFQQGNVAIKASLERFLKK